VNDEVKQMKDKEKVPSSASLADYSTDMQVSQHILQENNWGECLWNDVFCIEQYAKPLLG